MVDLPAGWAEQLKRIDWEEVREQVRDYGPALHVVQETWSRESLIDIAQGKVFVPDGVLNEAIEKSLPPDGKLVSLVLASKENGRLEIAAEARGFGKVELSGEVKAFVHEGDSSYVVYRVRERNLPGKGLASWIFSRISLSMAQQLVGRFEMPENLPMEIRGNTVRIDYSKALAASDFGKARFMGHRFLDMIEIKGATPRAGGIEFQTELLVPDDVKAALLRIAAEAVRSGEASASSASAQSPEGAPAPAPPEAAGGSDAGDTGIQ